MVGPDGDPAALGDVPPHVHPERFVPQEKVLPHLDIVVHHGGTGTMLGALMTATGKLPKRPSPPKAAEALQHAALPDYVAAWRAAART